MAKKRVCEICGTVFDENRDVCPLCDTPYQADLDETQVFSAAELEATAAAGKKKKQKRLQNRLHYLLSNTEICPIRLPKIISLILTDLSPSREIQVHISCIPSCVSNLF